MYKHLVRYINGQEISQVFCEKVEYGEIEFTAPFKSEGHDGKVAFLINPAMPIATDESVPFNVTRVPRCTVPYQALVSVIDVVLEKKVADETGKVNPAVN